MHATTNPIEIWHKTILDNDPSELFSILDDSFQFYSPAVFKSKEKYMGYIYLLAASQSFLTSDFKYTREIIDKEQAVLEFECIADENGYYEIEQNDAFGPETYSWIYLANFFSPTQSGAYRLPNGNTLVTVTTEFNFFEVIFSSCRFVITS